MSNPLHAAHYADGAVQQRVTVVENVRIARDTWRVRFRCPELAASVTPGQFVMLRLADYNDPLLGRPLALYNVIHDGQGRPECIDVVYLVMGKMTSRLIEFAPGSHLDVWGPLGNGFPADRCDHLIMVAGGIGQTPFPAVAAEALGRQAFGAPARTSVGQPLADKVTLCYGARTADYLAGVSDFEQLGVDVRVSTDDGSTGHHGLVTDLLEPMLAEATEQTQVLVCGPEPMMEAVADRCVHHGVNCRVSLETPMACGIGICFSCVAKVRDAEGAWDYKRTCVDGPVFEASCIEW